MDDIKSLLHDFNNLLTTILGNTEMIELAGEFDASVEECLSEIRKAAEKANAMIEDYRTSLWDGSQPGGGDAPAARIPRGAARGDKDRERLDAGFPACGVDRTILVVEDEEPVRKMICRVLEKQGYGVVEAADVYDAVDIVLRDEGEDIDLLLTDVVMPGMNGTELAERILSLRADMKVVYISGYTDESVLSHAHLQEGINFLKKPFLPRALADMIRMSL